MTRRLLPLFLAVTVLVAVPLPHAALASVPVAVGGKPLPSLAPMLQKVTPAVVNIATRTRVRVQENPLFQDPFFRRFFNLPDQPQEREAMAAGSGVIVDAEHGYVLTNNHVVGNADEIEVTLRDGRTFRAKLVGADPEADIAVVKIKAKGLTALPLADSDKLRVGDFVVAIGNPFALGQTVTSGIVSALGRTGLGIEGYEDFIQTDASINPGNSGGALVNLRGELVGINTAIIGPSGGNVGIGFAIPSDMARDIMDQLVKYGEVRRGMLGVGVQDLTPNLARAFHIGRRHGAVIANVVAGLPAAKAGLRVGDIVVGVNGRPVRGAAQLRNSVGLLRVGQTVTLNVLRGDQHLTIKATIAAPKVTTLDGKRLHPRLAGAELSDIQEGSDLYGKVQGVEIAKVRQGSPAYSAGLRAGDVILSINRHRVHSLQEARQATDPSRPLLLNVQRGDSGFFALLQ